MTTDSFQAKRQAQAAQQAEINNVYADQSAVATIAAILAMADADHAQYPQYAGYWDGPEWTLAKCTTPIRSKGGLQADIGDVVLFRSSGWAGCYHSEFYSARLGWMCSCGYGMLVIRSRYTGEPVGR